MSLFFDVREVEGLSSIPNFGASLKFPVTRNRPQYTHWLFNRYPARSLAEIPRCLINATGSSKSTPIKVLDPFSGSGTTAVEAILAGAEAYGVEIDPFARLLATVRTTALDERSIDALQQVSSRITSRLSGGKVRLAELPDLPNLDYWFPAENIRALRQLRWLIENESDRIDFKNFFLIVMAEVVRPCSFAERQTLKPYISKRYPKKPEKVVESWAKHLNRDVEALREFSRVLQKRQTQPIRWLGSDATTFRSQVKCDIAITSPPYVNALDYVRCTKFESAWIGLTSQASRSTIRSCLLGEPARVGVNSVPDYSCADLDRVIADIAAQDLSRAKVVLAYFNDLAKNLKAVGEALNDGATYWIIVGENEIRGVHVGTHLILAAMANQVGFSPANLFRYVLRDHRTSIPRKGRGGKIEYEYVLGLTKKKSIVRKTQRGTEHSFDSDRNTSGKLSYGLFAES